MTTNIAIDGPAGAGKSTIAKKVARQLSFIYVDTGAMYRAMALHLLRCGISGEDRQAIAQSCLSAQITIAYEGGEQQVLLNGENVTSLLRTEEVGDMASKSSAISEVREKLVSLQQELAAKENVVMDGRDIGTIVLPNAAVKIYLTASTHTRALRRYKELMEKGEDCALEVIEADIKERDYRDMTRDISPLKQAEDAVMVDSSEMTIDEVVEKIITIYEEKR